MTDAAPRLHTRSDRFLRRYRLLMLGLLLLAAIVYLAGNNLFPLVDRDEPRYAQSSRQMLQSGDWIVPRFLDELRLKKPVLIYWLQATAMRWLDDTAFAARLPSAVATLLTLGVLAAGLPRMIGFRRAAWATFIFATALMPTYLAKASMTDAVLHLWIALAMLGLYAVWRGTANWLTYLTMGLSIGLAVLTKGPGVFMFLSTTLIALWALNHTLTEPLGRRVMIDVEAAVPRVFLRATFVLVLAATVCVPWALALEHQHPGSISQMLGKEVIERGRSGQEGHAGPPGYYLVTFWVTYLPWSLFWPAAIWHGWKRRHVPWVRFSLAAILGPWLFLEIYKTKLPHYWLPSYPFMAILTADVLLRGMRARIFDFRERSFIVAARVFACVVGLVGLAVLVLPFFGQRPFFPGYLAAVGLAIGFGLLAWGAVKLLEDRRLSHAALTLGLGTWALVALVTTLYWPATSALTLAQRVGQSLVDIGATGDVQMIGFKEPSVAFYQGGHIHEQPNRAYLSQTPHTQWPRWTVMDQRQWDRTTDAQRAHLRLAKTLVGLNLANGMKREHVYLLEKQPSPTTLP